MDHGIQASSGDNVGAFRDPKRLAWLWGGLLTFSLPLWTIAFYHWSGGIALIALLLPAYIFVLVPILDMIVGEDLSNPPEKAVAAMEGDPYYMLVVRGLVLAGYISMLAGIGFLASVVLPWWAAISFLLGLGIVNGTLINLAHELGHKTNQIDRFFAKVALGAIGYGHFTADHNLGHHKNVATPEDCASARMGETVYEFAVREMPGALFEGWHIEATRMQKRGLKVWSQHNEILQSYAISLAVGTVMVFAFGWEALPFILAHHFFAFFALTLVNYIEHYGLLRQKLANGRYEPCQTHHSWNTNHIVSNVMQIHLQRHSDHHTHPMRPYQALRNFPELPRLPSGYPGCLTLAVFPPLWFRIIDPKVMAWANDDLSKVNIHERARKRLEQRYTSS